MNYKEFANLVKTYTAKDIFTNIITIIKTIKSYNDVQKEQFAKLLLDLDFASLLEESKSQSLNDVIAVKCFIDFMNKNGTNINLDYFYERMIITGSTLCMTNEVHGNVNVSIDDDYLDPNYINYYLDSKFYNKKMVANLVLLSPYIIKKYDHIIVSDNKQDLIDYLHESCNLTQNTLYFAANSTRFKKKYSNLPIKELINLFSERLIEAEYESLVEDIIFHSNEEFVLSDSNFNFFFYKNLYKNKGSLGAFENSLVGYILQQPRIVNFFNSSQGNDDYYFDTITKIKYKKNIMSILKKIENINIVNKFDFKDFVNIDFREIIKEISDQEVIAFYADKIEVGLSIFS